MEKNRNRPEDALQGSVRSETQRVLSQLREGEAWSHRAVAMGYLAGGNEGQFLTADQSLGDAGDTQSPTDIDTGR
ncbi:hypothetical protein [Symbiobacterium thermophilum]|uniref:Uncharacterized protein n=2 Tax=Symbiobacterium thermophilum TaxID=2734 RepID=Q67T01_SYMTH|nr:hypothetical protein [Symbiobacterium thermophilum]MBY6275777.1 hypothetical protein [Symbiobacterium thermophilum]BAD39192.1 conserved hypothetical protein [Symbiobacterium thermophilum IAM 14863]